MRRSVMALLLAVILIMAATSFADVCGDVNNDGSVNILDIVFLINYKYKAGPEPDPTETADVNSDGIINILDIVYLINFKYKNGPEPFCGMVKDIDGNIYHTVKIGNQWWMVENLKVTHYRNGNAIPNVTDFEAWTGLSTGAYCEYDNNVSNVVTYGRLYNWNAVVDSRNIAPVGWHIPTEEEWQTLADYLGGSVVAGGKMKESGTAHWSSPNTGATNESGFAGLPGGYRSDFDYDNIFNDAFFWSSTESSIDVAWSWAMNYNSPEVDHYSSYKRDGFSVRCVRDYGAPTLPVLTTSDVSAITQTTAQCGGNISSDGGAAVTERGVCWSTNPTPTVADSRTSDGTGIGSFTSSITGLTGNTSYYVRAYATNSVGTGYGSILSFTTSPIPPDIATSAVSAITQTTAECGGDITSDGGAAVIARGVCWSTDPTPTVADNYTADGTGIGSFTSSITGLTASITYYVRAYAINSAGTGYGSIQSFSTTDIDGNVYATVTIGTQIWMVENLKVTHYRNGDPIANVIDPSSWASLSSGAYCEYDNDIDNVTDYGRLYNWFAAEDGREIAPAGWHIPTDAEWQTLVDYLGGNAVSGGKMKEAGTTHWLSPNTGATNSSGFTGLPGGYRNQSGYYYSIESDALFWSATDYDGGNAWSRALIYDYAGVSRNYSNMHYGMSVRCVKDGDNVPSLTTSAVSAITQTTAECGGTITSNGGAPVTARGVCWSTNSTPTIADDYTIDGTGTGSFTSSITGLTGNTEYYVRAYATNSAGTGYGDIILFTTSPIPPTLTTASVSAITQTTAECGGNISSDGGAAVTARGVCWSTNPTPTIADNKTTDGTGTGSFVSSITGLTFATTYYVRAYAINSIGTGYGEILEFASLPMLPTLTTASVSAITQTTAQCGGIITSDGGGTITARGVCWSTDPTPTVNDNKTIDGTGAGSFVSSIAGLTAATEYYVRAYATNDAGTGYGDIISFTTNGMVTDIDGNTYNTVKIGDQWWMKENLKVTHYRNGEAIPNVTDNTTWVGLTSGAYCEFDNDIDYVSVYGRLYNWYAVADGRNIAPDGWHMPTDDEWKQLEIYLGMSQEEANLVRKRGTDEGGKLKETSITHWQSPNTGATNESGFTALGGGHRASTGEYISMDLVVGFWTCTPIGIQSWARFLNYDDPRVDRYDDPYRMDGFAIRCVKNLNENVPTVTTTSISGIGQTTAQSGGTVISEGGSPVTARGVCWSTDSEPTVDDNKTINGFGTGSFTSYITGLAGGTTYYVRAYATNSPGTGYGEEVSFTTLPMPPIIATTAVSDITQTTAECGGNISSDGGAAVTARGVCWSTGPTPTIADNITIDGTGTGSFTSSITGLSSATSYYARAYATNSIGTGYGDILSFTTNGTIMDIDGNTYITVKIGNQWWMKENLKVTHYRNGDAIPNITDNTTWAGLTTGAYCEYENNVNNVATYGRLYNWYSVDDSRNIAPEGWHVPSDEEWKQLEVFLGMSQTEADSYGWRGSVGGKLKEIGGTHWADPNAGATNESGFTGLPGGYRSFTYLYLSYDACFWSSAEESAGWSWHRYLDFSSTRILRGWEGYATGFSIRCVKD